MRRSIALALSLAFAVGCAATTVRKNPGDHDRGFRFYRPKPYLFIQPVVDEKAPTAAPQYVTITWEMRPDFSEQYSIRPRAGLGTNKTKITLEDGWNLSKVDFDIDSKTDENIKAFTGLIQAAAGAMAMLQSDGGTVRDTGTLTVAARNVPLGYYEAILDDDPCGGRRLYGWRYLGFAPFANCPTVLCGSQTHDCHAGDVYGLVAENGVAVFKKLDDIATEGMRAK